MILILFITGLLIGLVIGLGKEETCQENYSDNFISAFNCPVFIENQTLASITGDDYNIYQLAYRIIQCESSWNPEAKNKESSAYGLGQFINGTWEYVQDKWDIELDRYNSEDQMYATVRLLEEEGTKHWITSKSCWDK
jgi:hypothetical protein